MLKFSIVGVWLGGGRGENLANSEEKMRKIKFFRVKKGVIV